MDSKLSKIIRSDNVYIFDQVLSRKFDKNIEYTLSSKETTKDKNKDSLLMRACRYGSEQIVIYLIERGVNINRQKFQEKTTAVFLAAQEGHYEIVQLLLQKGADLNIASDRGITSLLTAADKGYYEIVQLLLQKGADFKVANCEGITSLYVAAGNRHYKIVELLLKKGANPDVPTLKGNFPIHGACYSGHYKIVCLLLKKRANINVFNNDGYLPIHLAIYKKHYKIVQLLLKHGSIYCQHKSIKHNKKIDDIFEQHVKFKTMLNNVLSLFALAREFCDDSLLHVDYLARDLFNVIMECIKNEIEIKVYYSVF